MTLFFVSYQSKKRKNKRARSNPSPLVNGNISYSIQLDESLILQSKIHMKLL